MLTFSQTLQSLPKSIWQKGVAERFVRVGLCVPSLCSAEDISELVEMSEYTVRVALAVSLTVAITSNPAAVYR